MSLRSTILATACIAAIGLAAGPAFADFGSGFSATVEGDYSNISAGSGNGSANLWGGAASGAFDLGLSGLKAQVDGGYKGLDVSSGPTIDVWNVDGALYWQSGWGRLGGTVGYSGFDGGGLSNFNITNYGGFAEWYASPMFTVGVKGGGASASGNGASGTAEYVGGEGVFYVMPDVALNGNIDYFSEGGGNGNITNYGGTVEWLFSERMPVSVFGGYTYTNLSDGGGHLSTWNVGVKFYLNGNGATTLVDRQRTGNANWATETNLINTAF